MKIELDTDLCEANGHCQKYCPSVFEVTDTDELIIHHEAVLDAIRDEIEMAVKMCPRQALMLTF